MRKTGIGFHEYMRNSTDENGVELLKKYGYSTVHFGFETTTTGYYTEPLEDFIPRMERMRAFMNERGIEFFQTHGPWDAPLRHSTKEDQDKLVEDHRRAIIGTRYLGAKYLVTHPLLPFDIYDGPDGYEGYKKVIIPFLERLLPIAEEHDVIICLENLPFKDLTVSRPEKVLEVVKEINSPYLKVCLDTGHSIALGINPADAVRMIGKEYLKTLHVHDSCKGNDYHWMPFAQGGEIDWTDFTKALDEIGYEEVVMLETGVWVKNIPGEARPHLSAALGAITQRIAGNIQIKKAVQNFSTQPLV